MKKILIFLFLIFICFFTSGVFAAGIVDINTASLAQLDELTGIGPTYAQRIIDNRPYSSVDDLLRVKGIGPATLQKIKDQGIACVNCSTVIPSLTGNPATSAENLQDNLDSRLRGNDNNNTPVIYPSGVFLNEILPNPEGPDETEEWIELYNSNNFDVDLSGWQIQDTNGALKTFTISNGTKILAGSFLVFKRPDTKIMLNNDADGLNLLTPDKKIVDSVNFVSAPLNQSFNKTSGSWKWSTTLTPGAKNIVAVGPNGLSKTKNSVKNDGVGLGLADISQILNTNQDNNTKSPWFLFFAVLAITIILAIIVLFIKLRFINVTKT